MHMEQTQHKKLNTGLLLSLFRGSGIHLLLGTADTVLALAFSFAAPFIVSFTLDAVILGNVAAVPLPVRNIAEHFGDREFYLSHIYVLGIAYVVLTLLNGVFAFLRKRRAALLSENVTKTLRDRLYRHLLDVPYDYHKHNSAGDLIQRCTSDVDMVRRFISVQLTDIIRTLLMAGIAIGVMYSLHPGMALCSTAMLPLLCAGSFIYFRYVRKFFTASDEAEGKISGFLQEDLSGMRVVRAFGQQRSEIERFRVLNDDFRDKTLRLNTLLAMHWGASDAAGYLQIAFALISGIFFSIRGQVTLGTVTLFVTYANMLTWPVRSLGRILADLGKAVVSFNRLDEILSSPAEQEPGRAQTPPMEGDIVFDHVSFGYDRPNDVLDDISFSVSPGMTVGILGSTGSGKTSLVQLLQRLYPVTGGSITINGVNINDIDAKHLRKNIGIVLQEPFLYARSLRDNIGIAVKDASETDIRSAARTACIDDVIQSFEDGYDTVVGERGVTLSGGQQQRVAIARTLMQNAPILIFDDSMSAVDTQTDAKIREALVRRRENGITFLISHRITTLSRADLILVLEHGRITGSGTHETLMRSDGLYRRIADIQGIEQTGGEDDGVL